jgi:hypothetical protein
VPGREARGAAEARRRGEDAAAARRRAVGERAYKQRGRRAEQEERERDLACVRRRERMIVVWMCVTREKGAGVLLGRAACTS